jgi:hypothetical protein
VPALNALAAEQFDSSTTYADRVHFVHVYVIEPHPLRPDLSPYKGQVWETPPYSTLGNPTTFAGRVLNAAAVLPSIVGNQLQLIDDLSPGLNNPAWCTYGTCPNCAFLIRQDGVIDTVQTWVEPSGIKAAIDILIAK